jgi:hypothetical protein
MLKSGEFTIVKELQLKVKEQAETIDRLGIILKSVMTELYQLKHKES